MCRDAVIGKCLYINGTNRLFKYNAGQHFQALGIGPYQITRQETVQSIYPAFATRRGTVIWPNFAVTLFLY